MKKEELVKLIKSLPDNKCLVTAIHGQNYILSCRNIETSKGSRVYTERVIADRATFINGENLRYTKTYHETTLYIMYRSCLSIDKDSIYLNIEILEPRIDKYKHIIDLLHATQTLEMPVMIEEQIDERLILKEQEKMKEEKKKQDEFNELVLKLKEHFVEFKKDAVLLDLKTPTTDGVNIHTGRKSSVIIPDYPMNEKWSDETILNIINFVNSGIVYDEKQYTIVSHAVIGFIGELAGCVVMGHAWDIKNKRVVILKEKHKKYDLFFKNGKYHHCLNIIPNEEIVASYKVQGVL